MRVPDLGKFANKDWPIQEKGFARMIQTIDQDVGRILELLDELGIDEETLVMFSSDNGPHPIPVVIGRGGPGLVQGFAVMKKTLGSSMPNGL